MKSRVSVKAREAIMCKNSISNEHILNTSRENPQSIAALLAYTHTIHYKHTHTGANKLFQIRQHTKHTRIGIIPGVVLSNLFLFYGNTPK